MFLHLLNPYCFFVGAKAFVLLYIYLYDILLLIHSSWGDGGVILIVLIIGSSWTNMLTFPTLNFSSFNVSAF